MKPTKPFLKSNKNKNLRKFIFYPLVLALFLFFCKFLFNKISTSSYFLIKDISISGTTSFINLTDLKTVVNENSVNKSIITFKEENLRNLLIKNFLLLKNVKVSKKYPKTLIIDIEERTPLAIVKNPSQESSFLIDNDGFVLGEVDPSTVKYPTILYEKAIKTGTFLSREDSSLFISALESIQRANISIVSLSIDASTIKLVLKSGTLVYLPVDKDFSSLSSLLKDVLRKYNGENVVLKRIDLRYDNVVVE